MNRFYYLLASFLFLFFACNQKDNQKEVDTENLTTLNVSLSSNCTTGDNDQVVGVALVFKSCDSSSVLDGRICFSCYDSKKIPIQIPVTAGTHRYVYVIATKDVGNFYSASTIDELNDLIASYESEEPFYYGHMDNVNTLNSSSYDPVQVTIAMEQVNTSLE